MARINRWPLRSIGDVAGEPSHPPLCHSAPMNASTSSGVRVDFIGMPVRNREVRRRPRSICRQLSNASHRRTVQRRVSSRMLQSRPNQFILVMTKATILPSRTKASPAIPIS